MPWLTWYKAKADDVNTMCYYNLLGTCALNNCSMVHIPKSEIPDGYITLLSNTIKPGMCKLCKDRLPSKNKRKGRGVTTSAT